jgi:hypothetical protein
MNINLALPLLKRWMTALNSAISVSTISASGAATLSGGIVATTPAKISNIPLGGVALASIGTDGASVAGTVYYSEIFIPANKTVTSIALLNGTTVGTDKVIYGLYSSTGTLLANTDLAGTLGAGADTFQAVALTTPYAAVGPARYWLALQVEGTTHQNQRIAASAYLNYAGKVAGTFGTLPATITPPTSTAANEGPIGFVV